MKDRFTKHFPEEFAGEDGEGNVVPSYSTPLGEVFPDEGAYIELYGISATSERIPVDSTFFLNRENEEGIF